MKTKKIIAHILVSFFFLQCSYAQETTEYITTKKTVVENKVDIRVRETPWIFWDRIHTVSQGSLWTLTGKETYRDALTWVEISYEWNIQWWVHKSLVSLHAQSYETQIGKVYTVYYSLSDKEKALFWASWETSSWSTEEIIWVTTDLRKSFEDKTLSWGKNDDETVLVENTTIEETVSSTNTMQDYDFRTEEKLKFSSPWIVPKEVWEVITEDQEEIKEVPVMLTTDVRSDTEIKFQWPWANKEAFEFTSTGSEDLVEEDTLTNMMQVISLRPEKVGFNVPWLKNTQTWSTVTQTWSEEVVVEKISSITSTIAGESKKYFLWPWATKEAFEFTDSGSTDEGVTQDTTVVADITTTFEQDLKTWDLYTFIFWK